MHLLDGFLDHKTSTGLGSVAAFVLAYAANKVHQAVTSPAMQAKVAAASNSLKSINLKTKELFSSGRQDYFARIGFVAGIVFSAQMFNFPISSGTSGHLLGGVLAAILLGPWAGSIAVSSVLIIQAFVYADGGIAALGANITNMAILGCIVPYFMYTVLKKLKLNQTLNISIVAWFSVVLAAAACAVELAISGTYPLQETLTAMLKTHAIIGIFEAIITIVLLKIIQKITNWEVME